MSATTQTAEPAKQTQSAKASQSNGHKQKRTRGPNKSAAKPAAPIQAAKVAVSHAAKVPAAAQTARTQVAMSPHPLVQGLFQTFPDPGADISEAKAWMDTANSILKQILKFPGGLTVSAMPSAA